MSLPVRFAAGPDQEAQVMTFLQSATRAARTMLGSSVPPIAVGEN